MDKNFDQIDSDILQSFMERHADLFKEAKWCLLMDIINNAKGDTDPAVFETMLKFFQVFRNHDVDPDIMIEAFSVLGEAKLPSKKQESNDISQDEFTNFVNVLNKIKKKGEEGNAAE
jgi:hypothetical protein